MTQQNTIIVGIGASAGGIQALKAFFSQVQDAADMAFVIVTHLSPSRQSHLHEVISHFTTLPVEVIKHGASARAGIVHVMPEHVCLSISDGHFKLLQSDPKKSQRKPIDFFFRALAVDQEEKAVGIVLSGSGDDGTLGLQAIKAHGGLTFAQVTTGNGLDYPQMPESALSSGAVDFALPVEQMPEKLRNLQKASGMLGAGVLHGEVGTPELAQRRMQDEISKLLRDYSGQDFAGYKSKTFFRRVARRMQVVNSPTPEAYLKRLNEDPAEVMALFNDLLISVTDFFRDKSAFDALGEQVMPSLMANRGSQDTIRVWVPGCATGKDVYSLAILIRENMAVNSAHPQVRIFATDIDEPALNVARSARYRDIELKNVSKERKERFFRQDGSTQVLIPEIRDMCIFSSHNLINDPPFSQMDLVSCRNLLIYLDVRLQERVISTFHYALKPGGFLFLGGSESLGQRDNMFVAIDKKHRIYRRLDLDNKRARLPIPLKELFKSPAQFEQNYRPRNMTAHQVRHRAEHQIFERHSPAHVVIRGDGEIVFFSALTQRYFETPRGAPNRQLFETVRRELRHQMRLALRKAIETGKPDSRTMVLQDNDAVFNVTVVIEPLNNGDDAEPMFLVVFKPVGDGAVSHEKSTESSKSNEDTDIYERNLNDLQERLQSTIEEYETALEELSTSNEELISVNEEAQSANEELQASKEEMQSLNEELSTVNADLTDKVEELGKANTDLRDVQDATGIAIVFLNRDMMIRSFTPAASKLLHLREADIGRPLTDLASFVAYSFLQEDIHEVFSTGCTVERRLPKSGDPTHYLVRTVPYLEGGETTGVVITFVDVTSLLDAEKQRVLLIEEAAERAVNSKNARLEEVQAADARKARLIAVLAHDLRTPLVAILSTLDLFRNKTENPSNDKMLHRLKTEGHGMLQLIDDVLELARLGAGEARLRPEPFKLSDMLSQIGDLVRSTADRHETEVVVQVDDLPMLIGDVMSLRRILLNFATNAVKATRGGSVHLSATRVADNSDGHTVTLSVTDTGCGIAPEDIPRLFRDFGMLERDAIGRDGTGLGLAICRRLATAMGGEVGVESSLGSGSRFWLRLTLPECSSETPAPDQAENDLTAVLRGLKVLVAEDHDIIRQLTCANLTRFGTFPTEAADGIIAVELAAAEKFDLILMDLQMPRLDGDEAASRIRRGDGLSANARIIGITAHQAPEIAVMLSDLAFDACLPKPLDIQRLAACVRGDIQPPPPLGPTSFEDFDADNLTSLRDIDGGVLLSRTLKEFSAEIGATWAGLSEMMAEQDSVEAGRLVHKLTGFSDLLGARTLSSELRNFQNLIEDEDQNVLAEALEAIDAVMTKTRSQLSQLIEEADRST